MAKFWEYAPFALLFLIIVAIIGGAVLHFGVTFGNPFQQLFFFNY